MRRTVVEDQLEQLGAGVVADRIHHPLALHDEAHVEIGCEDALALGQRRNDMRALRRDDGGHAAAAQRLAKLVVG
jgi:hypothetical protein